MTTLVGVLLLGIFALGGVVGLRRLTGGLSLPEIVAYGIALGWIVAVLAMAALATVFGAITRTIGEATGVVVLLAMVLLAVTTRIPASRAVPRDGIVSTRLVRRPIWRGSWTLPVLVGLLLLAWWGTVTVPAILGAIETDAPATWVGYPGADWRGVIPEGIGLTYTADQAGDTDRLGQPVGTLAALLMLYGFAPAASVAVVTGTLLLALIGALFGLSLRLTGRTSVAVSAVLLFVLGGGVGWILTASRINETGRPWASLVDAPWDRTEQLASNYTVENTVLALLIPYPNLMLVILLTLLASSLLIQRRPAASRWSAALAGLIGSAAVAADPASVVLVAGAGGGAILVGRTGSLSGPVRNWYDWRAVCLWVATFTAATVTVLWSMGGPDDWQWSLNALTGRDGLPWYWLKNGGWLVILVAIGLAHWSSLRRDDCRILAIGIPAVLVAHLMTATREGYVSAALPLTLFLGALLVAVALASLWSQAQGAFGRLMILIIIAMTVGSGILVNAQVLLER